MYLQFINLALQLDSHEIWEFPNLQILYRAKPTACLVPWAHRLLVTNDVAARTGKGGFLI